MATRVSISDHVVRRRSTRITTRDTRSMQRVIVKQGYLKKLPSGIAVTSLFKKPERRWFIFGVISQSYPYIEYYENEDCIFTGKPLNTIFLDTCLHLSKNQRTARYSNVFTIVLKDRKLSLIADTRDIMSEWCGAIEQKLRYLGIIDTVDGVNEYVSFTSATGSYRSSRTSSTVVLEQRSATNRSSLNSRDSVATGLQMATENETSTESGDYETIRHDARIERPIVDENPYLAAFADDTVLPSPVSNHAYVLDTDTAASNESTAFRQQPQQQYLAATANVGVMPHTASPTRPTVAEINASLPVAQPEIVHSSNVSGALCDDAGLPSAVPKYPASTTVPYFGALSPVVPGYPALAPECGASASHEHEQPPAYSSDMVLALNVNSPLKLRQLMQLKDEMARPGGIKVILSKSSCASAVALVDFVGKVWIAGWNNRRLPLLSSQLHIGDELISVHGCPVVSAQHANATLKSFVDNTDAIIVVKRLPLATAIVIKKNNNNVDDLGLEFAGGTPEVSCVKPTGLAASAGLTSRAVAVDHNNSLCNWWITEVNHQPICLYFRHDEIKQRLGAAGSYVTFVTQPAQLIVQLRRQLKTMKYFKDFVIE